MKAFSCIFTALWALISTVYAAPQPIPDPFLGFNAMGWSAKILAYCNRGWGGDGGCEAKGYYTFCCKQDYGGQFVHSKFKAINAGLGGCADGGTILCAE
ncbi:hypothetical protein CB0940_06710 [Cercospora beticola]|uniref:Uncharacterized protein n=1 Tax=Cercospora beticola TaxID=122368 RepID=A0A2G5H9A0_CERBT|nr:hypothetical protein CB0940_06710 [Cercospora beticola]PIA89110.1 hypothetical protein CB0940_06710 [Cercospora beticola]WPB02609.1 hypothetical protein RHO25_007245 [Cercospora beticola]CAK1358727.1 unnamed protein product [Cercospora beticola]